MIKQKVVSVNINTADVERETGHKEIELNLINKYLEEGYQVVDKFSTVSNANQLYCVNLTFILQKERK
ncbi:hypothetical protein [Algoriphagus marincola]|uniref:hypothetical protein n=1 Tax=Algoriphagus marincola TaxID=264027 RepID=UPI00047AD857|nr:hypothetical protein [Algoriphagus marincola]